MKRRGFLKMALVTAPLLELAERLAPARYVEALRARFYPGPVEKIDKREMTRPGKWAG